MQEIGLITEKGGNKRIWEERDVQAEYRQGADSKVAKMERREVSMRKAWLKYVENYSERSDREIEDV